MGPRSGDHPSALRSSLPAMLALFLATIAVFMPVAGNEFVNYDDPVYVTANPAVLGGLSISGLRWAFTALVNGNWHPLTWLSHMADVSLFGSKPAGHHLTSLAIHALSVCVLYRWARGATGCAARSAVVAAIFALHPLRVESVAWVAERKDVLSVLFGLLALAAFSRWVRVPRRGIPAAALLFHALSLMAKPMLVTLPLLLLLCDYWPLGRPVRLVALVREKIPFLLLSGVAGAAALIAQGSAVIDLGRLPLSLRALNALTAASAYLAKFFWPVRLAVFYPHPGAEISAARAGGALLLLAAVTFLAVSRRRSQPYLLAGWAWYLVALLPVIGLVQVGTQAMADRYTYLPTIGVLAMTVWGASDLAAGRPLLRRAAPAVAAALVVALSLLTWRQLGFWRDSRALFQRALAVTEGNWLAHNNLGIVLAGEGSFEAAVDQYRLALRIQPGYGVAHSNLAVSLQRLGRAEEARRHFTEALRFDPDRMEAHHSLGLMLAGEGRFDEAIAAWREAVRLDPGNAAAWYNIANAHSRRGRHAEAIAAYRQAVNADPRNADAHVNLGAELVQVGDLAGAIGHFDAALEIRPDHAEARANQQTAARLLARARGARIPAGGF